MRPGRRVRHGRTVAGLDQPTAYLPSVFRAPGTVRTRQSSPQPFLKGLLSSPPPLLSGGGPHMFPLTDSQQRPVSRSWEESPPPWLPALSPLPSS